jgi:hypothetical protein
LSGNYASEAGHWYWPDGRTCYTYTAKDGTVKNTTKREARKWGLYPSVSGIMDCEYRWALENWKIEEHIKTADANPRLPDEIIDGYVQRVKTIRREEAAIAPDLGSHIHGCIENHLMEKLYDQAYRDHVMGALAALGEWCGLDGLLLERSFSHSSLGYGGKCDVHKRPLPIILPDGAVSDFKSKDFGPGELPLAWDNHSMQLAAYREGFGMSKARGAIIYISTQVAGLTHLVEVGQDDLAKGWKMFCALLDYWKAKNGF